MPYGASLSFGSALRLRLPSDPPSRERPCLRREVPSVRVLGKLGKIYDNRISCPVVMPVAPRRASRALAPGRPWPGPGSFSFHEKATKVKAALAATSRSDGWEPARHASIRTLRGRDRDRCTLGSVQPGAAIWSPASVGPEATRPRARGRRHKAQSPGLGGWGSSPRIGWRPPRSSTPRCSIAACRDRARLDALGERAAR